VIGSDDQGDAWRQAGYDVRFDCGATTAARLSGDGSVMAVVDVLCFTTAVSVAVERGCSAVYAAPAAGPRAARLARSIGAALAVGREDATNERPWSLSPAALHRAPPVPRLVLPSVSGSAITGAVRGVGVAACLRNAGAVGSWLARRVIDATSPVTVIAVGERWPSGALRPALEDLLGAGAVIAALVARKAGLRLSREASAALALYSSTVSVPDAVRGCASGRELTERGYAEDVEIAVEVDADDAVPLLVDGAFRPAMRLHRPGVPASHGRSRDGSAEPLPDRRLTRKQPAPRRQARPDDRRPVRQRESALAGAELDGRHAAGRATAVDLRRRPDAPFAPRQPPGATTGAQGLPTG